MLRRLKLGTALSLGFAAAMMIAVLVAAAAYAGLSSVEKGVTELSDVALPNSRALHTYDEARAAIVRAVNALMIVKNQGEMRRSNWDALEAALKRLHESRKEWEALPSLDETLAVWKEMTAAADTWETQVSATTALIKEGEKLRAAGADGAHVDKQYDEQFASFQEMRKLARVIDASIVKVRAAMQKETRLQAAQAHASARSALTALLIILTTGAGILAVIAVVITRGISRVVRELTAESAKLTTAVSEGKLRTRADCEAVHFQFRAVVEGMNQTMDAFVKPIDVTADYVDRISKGAIPPKITERYEGDFDLIKQNLNRCIDAVHALADDAIALSKAAVEGKLSTRADAGRHEGDYRKIVQGVNDTLDAVVNPMQEASQVLERLAQRDLKARVAGRYQGDHAKIKDALNATAEALHESLAQVAQAVEQVSSASGQIAASSEAVATGASEQASSLEETSASLESMASMAKQAADNAQQANGLAQTAQGAATEGSAAMEQMTSAMGKIKASAEGTSQIIKDINEIAFQTNLLALNAAVEAARAGEAGRGFAVVAEEVRSLALRSKEAANKTEELIRQSVKEAGEGEVTAKHVNERLGDIAASVTKVSGIIAEIAATAKEQTAGIDQVAKAVMQMNQVTQQNAASSEESSSAAAELSGQSEELAAMVGTFQLERHASVAARTTAQKHAGAIAIKAAPARPTKANGHTKGRNGQTMPVAPSSVIPLDGDFKEF